MKITGRSPFLAVYLLFNISILLVFFGCGGATATESKIKLQSDLPPDVVEALFLAYYDEPAGCGLPSFESLRVSKQWSGKGNDSLDFTPPFASPISDSVYFLVVVGESQSVSWRFDSVLVSGGGEQFQSLRMDSFAPDQDFDAQLWCSRGLGVPLPDILKISAESINWKVYLISDLLISDLGSQDYLPEDAGEALRASYYECPDLPPLEDLRLIQVWESSGVSVGRPVNFTTPPPAYFIAVNFSPTDEHWFFRSTQEGQGWAAVGPSVNSELGGLIDVNATCLSSAVPTELIVDSQGGDWTVFLVARTDQSDE